MALIDLWTTSQDQLKDKHVQQMIAFAGDGRLLDESGASKSSGASCREFHRMLSPAM